MMRRRTAAGRPLAIAYLVGAFPRLSETFIQRQIAGVAARGHIVDIYTTCAGADTGDGPLQDRVQRLYPESGATWRALAAGLFLALRAPNVALRLLAILWRRHFTGGRRLVYAAAALVRLGKRRYDVIHAQFGSYGPLALQLREAGVLSGAIVTSFRGYDATRSGHDYTELYAGGDLFLPVSHSLAARLTASGCDPRKIRLHRSGVDCRGLSGSERRRAPGELTQLITVGRLVEKKGVRYGIEAAARLAASGYDFRYTVVGDGPQRAALAQLVREHGLSAQVRLVGAKPHDATLALIAAAHIMVAPSVRARDGDEEGVPNVLKEAMALGLPVVAFEHGGVPELVQERVSGFLVPERDVTALTQRLRYLIDRPETWPALGRAGRARVEAEFDIERLSDELIGLYRDLAGAHAPMPAGVAAVEY